MKVCGKLIVLVALSISATACAGRTAAWDAKGEIPERDMALLNEAALLATEADAFWALRTTKQSVLDAIVHWEQALQIDPRAHEKWAKLGRAYGVLALEYLAESPEEQASAAEKGITAAERALMLISPEFGERMSRGASLVEGMEVLGYESAAALYWYAVNLETWLSHQSKLVRIGRKDEADQAFARVMELDEGYLHGAIHRHMARRELSDGGDLELARQHLERALELSSDYLPTRLMLAEEIAVPLGKRELFEQHITFILEAEESIADEDAAEAEQIKERARTLLARSEQLF